MEPNCDVYSKCVEPIKGSEYCSSYWEVCGKRTEIIFKKNLEGLQEPQMTEIKNLDKWVKLNNLQN